MLNWIIQTYPGKELMRSWQLNIDPSLIKPLLDEETIIKLQNMYLEKMQDNYNDWMRNTIGLESSDWKGSKDPDLDENNAFLTTAPLLIFKMIDENLLVASTISGDMTNKVFVLSLKEVANFGRLYRDAIVDYKSKYFRDRTTVLLFTR